MRLFVMINDREAFNGSLDEIRGPSVQWYRWVPRGALAKLARATWIAWSLSAFSVFLRNLARPRLAVRIVGGSRPSLRELIRGAQLLTLRVPRGSELLTWYLQPGDRIRIVVYREEDRARKNSAQFR